MNPLPPQNCKAATRIGESLGNQIKKKKYCQYTRLLTSFVSFPKILGKEYKHAALIGTSPKIF